MDQCAQTDRLLLMLLDHGYTGIVHVHPECNAFELLKTPVSRETLIQMLRRNASPNEPEYMTYTDCLAAPKSNLRRGKKSC